MRVRGAESGQALIGAMITVTIVFALGGALAVAVSALLAQHGLTAQRYLNDLSRQNAIAAGAAYVAGDGLEVAPPLCPTSRLLPALGQGGEVSGVVCHQVDSIGTGGIGVLPLVWPDRNCSVTPVPSGNQQTLFWLNGAGVVAAYLDNSSAGSCGGYVGAPCAQTAAGPVAQVVLNCDLSGMASPYLHVTATAHAPFAARYAAYSGPYMPAPGSPVPVGGMPVQVVTSDLAGRGIQDLVTVNTSASSVSILSGNGNGSFQAKHDYQVGAAPVAIGIGDVNGDGHGDLVTVNSGGDTISVLFGVGDGTFQPKRDYPVGAQPNGLALGDFDGDGNLDIAVTATRWNSLTVLLNDGQGGFRTLTQAIGYRPTAIAAADFDRDGTLDLAIGRANAVVIWLGDNQGGFDPVKGTPPAASNPTSIAVADLNGDGIADLVFANSGNNSIATYLGRGDGTFNKAAGSPIPVGVSPTTVRLGDLNGDHVLDLAFTGSDSNSASFWYGDGKGGFRAAPGSPLTISGSPVGLALGDFNRDGRLDLAVSEAGANRVDVMLANTARGSVFSLVDSSASPYEEADVFVSANGQTNALSYEDGL